MRQGQGAGATRGPRLSSSRMLDKRRAANSVRAPATSRFAWRRGQPILSLFALLGDRLTAGQRILALLIKVRILVPQLERALPERALGRSSSRLRVSSSRPHRLAVRTPASHVGNTGSIPVGVANISCENHKAIVRNQPSAGARCIGSPLRMQLLPPRQHLDELSDATGSRLRLLRVLNAPQDGVAVVSLAAWRRISPARGLFARAFARCIRQGGAALRFVGSIPATVLFGSFDLRKAGRHHLACRNERNRLVAIDLRPHASGARGVNFWSHHAASNVPFCPSIHPQCRRASRSAEF